ncbi:serine hydrolase [Antarcticibacterium arcticum]|uniref:Serine hydrolase n=1 Tax=Antarcticibacterium arcticum TaxID=2585771 RepID=A0A5B8YGN6_9FLAO|nr:serine hydrolase [Antarcticibacterium arcticum]QED36268.1 serine hydrolase [Antarcticibacterium arcticum]
MTKNLLYVFLGIFCFFEIHAQDKNTDITLEKELREIVKDFKGLAGVYVYNLKTRQEAGIHADSVFPTASVVKVPILAGLFNKIEKGELSLFDTLIYNKERVYGGSGLMQFFKDSTRTDLRSAAALMITYSDNVTSIWSQELAGGGEEINNLMEGLGLEHTRVNSRTPGREDLWKKYGWGQTTPREMAGLLIKMRNRELVSEAASDEMYRMMTNSFYTDYALSQIPPYVQTAAKQGMVNQSRSELVMVNAPGGDYVFYIATKNNEDTSWEYENEAWVLQRKISAFLWNYFEPESTWKPAKNSDNLVRGLKY